MASRDRNRVVIDLTLDSESEDDDKLSSRVATVKARTAMPLPSHSSPRKAPTQAARPPSLPARHPSSPLSTRADANTISPRDKASSSRPPPAGTTFGNVGRRASAMISHAFTQATVIDTVKDQRGTDAKRRKLSVSNHLTGGIQGERASGPVNGSRDALSVTPTGSRPKVNGSIRTSSAYHMNSALKSLSFSPSVVDNMPTRAPRSFFRDHPAQTGAVTGLLSPYSSTPNSVEPIVNDSDSIEENGTPKVRQSHLKERTAFPVREQPSPLPSASPIPMDEDNEANPEEESDSFVVSEHSVRNLPPQEPLQQSPSLHQIHTSAPMSTPTTAHTGSGQEKADHLLIFLKEVKRLKWADITEQFGKDIPRRTYVQLQSHYSTKLNKRDRTQDPPILNLPSRFAAEAAIDWATVHANTAPPKARKEITDLSAGETVLKRKVGRPPAVRQARESESFGSESAPQRQRTRRAPPVNYTLPKLRTVKGGFEEWMDNENVGPSRSESPLDKTIVISGKRTVVPPRSSVNRQSLDARLGLRVQECGKSAQQARTPYLSSTERLAMRDEPEKWTWKQGSIQDWQGAVLHVDFSPAELRTVEEAVANTVPFGRQTRHTTLRRHLRAVLGQCSTPKLQRISHEIARRLRSRDSKSITSFVEDAAAGTIRDVTPQIQRLALIKPRSDISSAQEPSMPLPSILREREFGMRSRRGWQAASRPLSYQVKNQLMDTMGPKSTWTGASSDIHTVAWSPNGESFAAGAIAVTDPDSQQYNKPNVLVYGDTLSGSIHELGAHSVNRPMTKSGANSTHAMHTSQDPKLFTTVSSVAFAPSGDLMYSAGYDNLVCIWDVKLGTEQPQRVHSLEHKSPVEILAVNAKHGGVIATATKRTTKNSIKLLTFDERSISDEDWLPGKVDFASAKAKNRPDLNMTVNALKFDPEGLYLLAGFGANIRESSGFDTSGDICLWDIDTSAALQVHGSSRNVFDVAFNPTALHRGLFSVGCVANGNVNRGTRSVVRFFDQKAATKYTSHIELECEALDMNDVVWCPYDVNLFAAGCTDGRAYVWDIRNPDKTLYTLGHGTSLMPLQEDVSHERTDTGIRFLSWGQNARRLYSGSSDGVVNVWDVTQAQEDTFVKDLITTNSGIMSGAFTDDFSKLLLGEVDGTANILEVGRNGIVLKDAESLHYYRWLGEGNEDENPPVSNDNEAKEARSWIETGQLRVAPMGGMPKQQVIQGPNYEGPYDRTEDPYTHCLRVKACDFQRIMATPQGPQCALEGCVENVNVTTYEDSGDSGRSKGRIPTELRRQWLDEHTGVVQGKTRCVECGRPALPSTEATDSALCELCSFACFRCGAGIRITRIDAMLSCTSCGGTWEIGALGYECIKEPRIGSAAPTSVPELMAFGREACLERWRDVETTCASEEMSALTDYYFGLAIDRPESPLI